jgi:tagatose-1,6-bisphosphate aldolase non-catalytic subunit AgaZ/GatZ
MSVRTVFIVGTEVDVPEGTRQVIGSFATCDAAYGWLAAHPNHPLDTAILRGSREECLSLVQELSRRDVGMVMFSNE